LPDNRDVLAQMMALKQPPPGGLGAPAPTMRPPGDAMVDSPVIGDWAPNRNAPFAGLEGWDWKNPNLPPMATGQIRNQGPENLSPADLDMARNLYKRFYEPYEGMPNQPVDINNPALWAQIQRDSR